MEVWRAAAEGRDVYLFLTGMIALAELAATQGVFSYLAGRIARNGRLSAAGVYWWVYGAGVPVTALLSNDATILLLTPAAIALARRTNVSPLPAAFAVAFVANAASFVLPISNPANLLLYPDLPASGAWLASFLLPSIGAIVVTGVLLFFCLRRCAAEDADRTETVANVEVTAALRLTIVLVALSCAALVTAATLHANVGITAFGCALISVAAVSTVKRGAAADVVREGQWSIVPLVAALLVAVHFADRFGAVRFAQAAVHRFGALGHPFDALATGGAIAALANAINNLPAAVLAHYAASGNPAALIGIDLGPNVALTGSLATILWIRILRKNGITVPGLLFLRIGLLVTVPALVCSLALLRV
ncbi:MAG TPA: SLC13 family permease [Candidatus Baltobacteraceae bacterium]|nr:SLC13 family permease [Candidatus Baltobacteraceae bacterium]